MVYWISVIQLLCNTLGTGIDAQMMLFLALSLSVLKKSKKMNGDNQSLLCRDFSNFGRSHLIFKTIHISIHDL